MNAPATIQTAQGPLEVSDNPRVAVGGNNPPATAYEALKAHIEDLWTEANNFLDGEPVTTQAQADALSLLIDNARKAKAAAEEQRKAEVKPFDEGRAAVQALWTPFTKDKVGKCDLIAELAKRALDPFLLKQEDEIRAAAEVARQEAERKAAVARTAMESAGTNLSARAEAEALLKDASVAERGARKAESAKAHATGGSRAIGLRTAYVGKITDEVLFARWIWANRKEDMTAFLEEVAAKEARQGPRPIPGLLIEPQRKV